MASVVVVIELLDLPFLRPDRVKDSLHAYRISKRGNSLRVMGEAVRWGKRGARINAVSPGIIITRAVRGGGERRVIPVGAPASTGPAIAEEGPLRFSGPGAAMVEPGRRLRPTIVSIPVRGDAAAGRENPSQEAVS